MADKKVSELTAITNLTTDDLIMVVNDPAGTASSRKVTVGNLFGNVAVITKHSSNTTFTANTTFNGTTMTVSANLMYNGTNIGSKFAANTYLQSYIANTNLGIRDRMQVANTTTLVNDRLQVANATATFATKAYAASNTYLNTRLIAAGSLTQANSIIANISANTPIIRVTNAKGLRVTTRSSTPATSNAVTEGLIAGTIFFSNTHLYVVTDSNTIKRVNLSTF